MTISNEQDLRTVAILALDSGRFNDTALTDPGLRSELSRLCKWWHRAKATVDNRIVDEVISYRAEDVFEWCVSLAKELIAEEIENRDGPACFRKSNLEDTRADVWAKFKKLSERGQSLSRTVIVDSPMCANQ